MNYNVNEIVVDLEDECYEEDPLTVVSRNCY